MTFRCKLDKKAYKRCKSPVTYKRLKPGQHKISVLAVDAVGNRDRTPATKKFRIRKSLGSREGDLQSAVVPITFVGQVCARRGCSRPHWKDGLCNRCWRFAQLFKKDPRLLAYDPLDGYRGSRDAVELPWEEWEKWAGRGEP